jgi:hypothetical protein
MVSVKIECPCGQHYAFDVEPVNGRMAAAVACPICGADGTEAANAILASKLPPPFTRPPARKEGVGLFPTAPPVKAVPEVEPQPHHQVRPQARILGLVDRDTAETEARAKISWGDSQDDVVKYLMLQGFSAPEAQALVKDLFKERLAALRIKGIRKIAVGCLAMCAPIFAWGAMAHIGIISAKLLGASILVALWGIWELLNGIVMLVAPKMESGDLAE